MKLTINKTLVLIFLINCSFSHAATYYFSSLTGLDSYTTTQAQNQATPWQTITKLNSIMNTLKAGDRVLFKCGETFYGVITITVSGALNNPIVFSSYGTGNKPIIDSRLALTTWTNVGANLWEATHANLTTMPSALMIADVLQPLGRYPNIDTANRGYLTIDSHPIGSKKQFTDNTLTGIPDFNGAEVVVRTDHFYLNRLTNAIQTTSTISFAADSTSTEIKDQFGYFFQNHPSCLDTDGDWCYIASGNKIRMYSTINPGTRNVSIANSDAAITSTSKSFYVVDGLKINGAKFYGIRLLKATYCTVKNCDFTNSGTSDLYIGSGYSTANADSINIQNNSFSGAQSVSIYAWGSRISITGNTFTNVAMVPGMGEDGERYMGIYTLANGILIQNNTFTNIGYTGISFLWSNDVVINQNVINNFCTLMDDGGGIYCWTEEKKPIPTNRKITNNIILNGVGATAGTNGTYAPAEGIYLDDQSPNTLISGNTVAYCANAGIYLHNSPLTTVKNNTVFSCNTNLWIKQENAAFPVVNCDIQNNIFASTDLYATQSLLNYKTMDFVNLANLGIMNNNIFCQPFSLNDYIDFYSAAPTVQSASYNVAEWKAFSGYDALSTASPIKFTPYSALLTSNGISNGTFTSNLTGWIKYNGTGNTITLATVSGILDGNCMSLKTTGTGGSNSSRVQYALPAITAGKSSLVRMSVLGTLNASIACQLYNVSASNTINLSTNRLNKEILFKATATGAANLFINFGPEDGTFYIDNVESYEVTPTVVSEFVRFEYNATSSTRTIIVDKNYITPTGVNYTNGSNINIPPFGSIVLLKNTNITTVINPKASEKKVYNIFPNPASDKIFLKDENGEIPENVIIYDISGTPVREIKSTYSSSFDVSNLIRGLYFVKVFDKEQTMTLKLIKL